MARALELAAKAAEIDEVPVGALVVRGDHVLGEGYNEPISSHDPTAHAEIIAIRQAAQLQENYRLPGSTLYVTIEPCAMCAGAIVHSRIERVVFAATEPKAGAVCSHLHFFDQPQLNHVTAWTGGVMAEQATDLIQAFFARRRQEKKQARQQNS
ncbi:tRNA adenosine(34) deaminase TadA [Spongiibacter sp. KMU-158]|uniref:tRNA-specific adenosine deaminase n=2 Tax=Spongiibacter pelagi TaxID=2760804 RepID=A0A927GY05_9GAMM|nr:tRNA adenosine(34) deaminase TadA [Spongiibacter pelagi]